MALSTLLKFNLRYYRRHLLLSMLCLMGISLGVGIVVAVELINDSALSSFSSSVDFLSGKATHSIDSSYGSIDETLFTEIWKNPDVKAAAPIIEALALTLETGEDPIRFVGLDPFLDAEFRDLTPARGDQASVARFLSGDVPHVFLSEGLMRRYGLKEGDLLTVLTAGIEKKARIIGLLPEAAELALGENVAILDIAAAQEVFGKSGRLDRIDVVLAGDPDKLSEKLPEYVQVTDRTGKIATMQSLLRSFQLNLTAMSLLALFVGTFLIYNFSMFSVLSRREDVSLLLTLGSDRRELVAAFLLEALLLGIVGSILGIGFGYLIAWLSMEKVSSTITELYFYVRVEGVRLTMSVVLLGFGIGYLATFLGTALPALEVAGTQPILGMKRQTIEDRARGLKGYLLAVGIVCFGAALVTAWASRFSIYWGWISAFAVTLAFAFATPSIISPLSHYAGLWFKKTIGSVEAFLAARTIRASLSRTSIAVAALAVALSVNIGVDNMIYSFRESVRIWLGGTLQGDLYISPATTKWAHSLPGELLGHLSRHPDVKAMERYSTYNIRLNGKPAKLRVVDGAVLKHYSRFTFLDGNDHPWDDLQDGGLFISESLGHRFNLGLGDRAALHTPEGKRSFLIVGVVRDYSSDQGTIHIDREVYEKIWQDTRVQSVALFLDPSASPDEVRKSATRLFPSLERTIVSNVKMKENILYIFDKTFAVTATLKGISLLVALLGVATALMAILIERSKELTVLAYLGMTPGQIAAMNACQAVLMGLVAYLLAVLCGIVLTYVITYAINYQSFGWSIDIFMNPWVFLKTFALTLAASGASAVYPSYRLITSRTSRSLEED
ncbi:ABC transporter permease [Thermodesulfobacteriota bacterium]